MRLILLFSILFLFGSACQKRDIPTSTSCTWTPDPAYASHPQAAQYQGIIDQYVALGLPGISMYIQSPEGEWAGAGGMADIDAGVSFQPCTVSKVASITKMMVGTLTMLLAEDGIVDLEAPIDPWLPSAVLKKVANCKGATIRQLMSHTTGIYDIIADKSFYLSVLNDPDKHWEAIDLIEFAYDQDANFPLGSSCRYSNTNTLLLSMVLDRITGTPHQQLLQSRILSPLGMDDTYYYSHDVLPPQTAQGYFDLYNNGTIANVTNFNTGSGNGYGGMFSTVFDIATFIRALVVDQTLLKPESLTAMQQFIPEIDPEDPAPDLFLGAGMMKRYFNQPLDSDNYAFGHTGRDLAYSANCFYFPVHNTICCFIVNYGTNGKSALREVFYDFQAAVTDAVVK
ncbi:MAG: beta-lactamase family protein [Saprospiraceae bacterium]|nr:beta-lactamase family protein [Saprospiraceae bacterium]